MAPKKKVVMSLNELPAALAMILFYGILDTHSCFVLRAFYSIILSTRYLTSYDMKVL